VAWTVAIGVDTHARTHVAVALDRLARVLGSLELAVDEDGFAALARFARSLGVPAFAVEDTGSYGASLARGAARQRLRRLRVRAPRAPQPREQERPDRR